MTPGCSRVFSHRRLAGASTGVFWQRSIHMNQPRLPGADELRGKTQQHYAVHRDNGDVIRGHRVLRSALVYAVH